MDDAPPAGSLSDRPWRGGWAALVVTGLARGALVLVVGLLAWSVLPAAVGWQPASVLSGSMEPRLHVGDVVAARPVPARSLVPGQVLLVDDPDRPDHLRLHRLASFLPQGGLVLRGDANRQDDSSPVDRSAVHGVATLRTPGVGLPLAWLHARQLARVAATGVVLLLLVGLALLHRPDEDLREAARCTSPTEPTAPTRRRSWRPRLVTTGVALLMITIAAAGGPVRLPAQAFAAYSRTTANPTSSWQSAVAYRCSSAVAADNPYLFYRLNEASGTVAVDSSANNRDGSVVGGVSRGTAGPCSGDSSTGTTLNGSTGYVTTPGAAISGPTVFTVEVWFKTTVAGGLLIGFGNAQSGASTQYDRTLVMGDDGRLNFSINPLGNGFTLTTSGTYANGAWHLATVTDSAAGIKIYVDGTVVATASYAGAQDITGWWRIGYDETTGWANAPTNSFFNGTLANAAVYTTALSSARVAAHYAGR